MTDYRKAYGLPERYFLSLGRMVEKKNLATLIAAYGRYCDEWRVTSDESARQAPASLVFVGSGELENALREQARALGLRVVDRTEWKAGQSGHGLTRMDEDGSERLAADRTEGNADGRMTSAADEGPQKKTANCELTTGDSGAQRGAVFFYGFRQIDENAVFYALAEAFVLPSLKEEWGLVVNEAMAAGLPVIVSRTAGCAEDLLPASGQVTGGEWRVTSGEEEGEAASRSSQLAVDSGQQEADARAARPYLELRSNGFVFDPKSVDALSEALRRIADQEPEPVEAGGDSVSPRDEGRGQTKRLRVKETSGVSEMGRRSREIVAKFSCENFAKQALHAAEAAQLA